MTPLLLILFLLPTSLALPQKPNTDGFFLLEFLRQMGSPPPHNSSSLCPQAARCTFENDHLVLLSASGLGLRGPIPANTIGKLGMLRDLDLSHNNITAFSPDFWSLGNSLRNLNLSANRIDGPLPDGVGNLGKLEKLDLSSNLLSGWIPVQVWSMGSLTHLNLSKNLFNGVLPPEIVQRRSLISVDLSSNLLGGNLPSDLNFLVNLSHLNLAGNVVTGKLPNFSGLESLEYLNLSRNRFAGSISDALCRTLHVVDLSSNQFTGHISQVSLNYGSWPGLTKLDLSGNRLSGTIFADLGAARSLRYLSLADNRFTRGKFPEISELSGLEFLNFSKIGLIGKIPVSVRKLVNLSVLDLSHNHLEGQIPDLSIRNLKVLDLSSNNLTGQIPMQLQRKLHSMSSFNFSYNNLTFCSSSFPPVTLKTAFIGSRDDCPIAVNPDNTGVVRANHRRRDLALAIAASAIFLMGVLMCIAIMLRRRGGSLLVSKQIASKDDPNLSGPFSFETDSTTWIADVKDASSVPVVIFEKPLLSFTFSDLLSVTSHFDRGTLLAEGKFGPVYRGFLPGGFNVAIKVLVHGSTLTDQEAAIEFERLGRINHPNLVPLTGYCLAGDQRIAVYEYMEHGNLQNLLHDLPLGVQPTDDWSNDTWEDDNDGVRSITSEGQTTWKFRHRIALGTARALAFLHHGCIPQIVHRDVKASSVYLDSAFEPRLSDFGLAKIVGSNFEDEIARVSPGYTPPELTGPEASPVTSKSDVYAFGVVLFELITGKKPVSDEYPDSDDTNLVSWVRGLVKRNQAGDAIDPKIYETGQEKQMEEALRVGYLCTADAPLKRPSMQQIVGLLKDIEPCAAEQ